LLTVDRIENGIAVVETDSGHIQIPLSEFAEAVCEGDIIVSENGGYKTDKTATQKQREEIAKKLSRMWEK
jgi:hypothetical protein